MLTEKPKFENPKNNNKSLDIADVINESVEIYKKTALMGGLAFMLLMAIISFFGIIGIGYFFRAEELQEVMKNFDPDKLSVNGMIIYFSIVISISVFSSPFIAGMLKMAHDAANNLEVQFSSLYYYVNNVLFPDILLVTFFTAICSVGISFLAKFIIPGIPGEVLSFVLSYTVSILTFIALPLVLFKNLTFVDALLTSVNKIARNFFPVLLLMIVAGIFGVVGIFAFCIGIFFTLPAAYAIQYVIQKKLSE